MSEDKKDDYSWENPLGIVTQFDELNFGLNENIGEDKNPAPKSRTKFTIDDIYILLRKLKGMIDPKNIERIERIVIRHVNDKNNPHDVTIEQLVTTIMNELYNDFLNYLNRTKYNNEYTIEELRELISTEQFLKLIFQDVKLADEDEALAGTATNKMVTPYSLNKVVEAHNTSDDAHKDLFESLLPGTMHPYIPTIALIAECDPVGGIVTNEFFTIRRSATIQKFWYMNSAGKIVANTDVNYLPVDYSSGRAAYPFFNIYTNYCKYSNNFTNNTVTKTNVTVDNTSNSNPVLSMIEEANRFTKKTNKVISTANSDPVEHKLSYTLKVADMQAASPSRICVSIYAKPGTITNVGINVYQDTYHINNAYHYNLDTNRIYFLEDMIDENITGYVDNVPGGWRRLVYACDIDKSKDVKIDIALLDIFDSDFTFNGDTTKYCFLEGLQIEFDTDMAKPLVPTNGATAMSGGAICELKTSMLDKINLYQLSVFFDLRTDYKNTRTTNNYVFTILSGNTSYVHAYIPPNIKNTQIRFPVCGSTGATITNITTTSYTDHQYHRYGYGYCTSGSVQEIEEPEAVPIVTEKPLLRYGYDPLVMKEVTLTKEPFTGDIDAAYIGTMKGPNTTDARYSINAYIAEFIYYPYFVNIGNLQFYLKN